MLPSKMDKHMAWCASHFRALLLQWDLLKNIFEHLEILFQNTTM